MPSANTSATNGNEYLDLLSAIGVFAIGRNHPTVISALQETLTLELPNLVQRDVSILSGLLAKKSWPQRHKTWKIYSSVTPVQRLLSCDRIFPLRH